MKKTNIYAWTRCIDIYTKMTPKLLKTFFLGGLFHQPGATIFDRINTTLLLAKSMYRVNKIYIIMFILCSLGTWFFSLNYLRRNFLIYFSSRFYGNPSLIENSQYKPIVLIESQIAVELNRPQIWWVLKAIKCIYPHKLNIYRDHILQPNTSCSNNVNII